MSSFHTFTRNEYDKNAYELEVQQSENVGEYMLKGFYGHPQEDVCYQPNVEFYGQDQQLDIAKKGNDMVDVESDLKNLPRRLTKDPKKQYPFIKQEHKKTQRLAVCNDKLVTKYSRLEGPTFKRGLAYGDVNFSTPIHQPQILKRIHSNDYIGENTYLSDVQSFKVKKPKIMDISSSLPSKEQLNPMKYASYKK